MLDKSIEIFATDRMSARRLHLDDLWFVMFRNKVENRFVGRAGLHNTEIEGNPEIELAYDFAI